MNANLTISEEESSVCKSNMCENIQTYTHEVHKNSEALESKEEIKTATIEESREKFLEPFQFQKKQKIAPKLQNQILT